MYDAVLYNSALAQARSDALARLGLTPGAYLFARADPVRIATAARELAPSGEPPVVFGDGRASSKIAEILAR